ncbi:MAG: ATP-dependent RecD-like DNA helicase [Bacilli bacterium]|nr:ATP-dependent RecD-like DNA helicase [Bacilli bacterium]
METYIKGNYRKSIYQSDKGYVIGLFKVRETNDEELEDYINRTITFTGYFYELNEDDTYIFYGEGVKHPRYGFQFQVGSYEKVKPTDREGVIEFLSSDLFPGVGEKLAFNIVDTLGDDALNVILKKPEDLNLVPKLTKKVADKIVKILKKYEESHEIIVYLNDLGFNTKEALSVYGEYKSSTIKVAEDNIYQILYDLNDVSFSKVDGAALKMGIDRSDKRRLEALTLQVLKRLTYQNGDSFLNKDRIKNGIRSYFGMNLSDEVLDEVFERLSDMDEIVIDGEDYYLREIYEAEDFIVNCLFNMTKKENKSVKKVDDLLKQMEENYGIEYNKKQKEAVKKAISNNFLIITGGPGTGKTTIIKAITEVYEHINKLDYDELVDSVALLAPTGRASKRMSESTDMPAYTIHRFLKWNKDTSEFMINEDNKSNVKMVVVDESSMIDINLFYSLLKGLKSNVKMILVGDYNQLPSVGPGQLLKDFILCDCVPIVHLDLLYRQDENSYINTLALEIKDGEVSDNFLNTYSDYTFLKCSSQHIKKNLKNICQQVLDKGYDYKRVQLLAPMYKGENGIDLLNKELQEVFNPPKVSKKEIKYGDVIFRENDKVLQLVNMPDENIFNGDIGIIRYIKTNKGQNEIYVDFDGNVVKYTPKNFASIKHGYIISIHKSQGSEFELIIMPITHSYNRMLYKKLIYTGITRAKKKLIMIGEPDAFLSSVYNDNEYIRNSKLLDKIKYKFEKAG